MSDSYQIRTMIRMAERMPYGDVRVSMHEDAVREADATGDIDLMFDARLSLLDGACFSGQNALGMPAVAWCLARYNAEPDRFGDQQFSLLWGLKNVLSNCYEYPQISKKQFNNLLADMEQLYRRTGYSMRPVHQVRRHFAVANGDRATAEAACAEFLLAKRDGMADCLACETDSLVEYYQFLGDHEKSVHTAKKIMEGKQRCAEVPHRTYNQLLRSLVALGRDEDAERFQTRGYRLVRTNPKFLGNVALQMLYLVQAGKLPGALKMLERHLSWALESRELRSRYLFYVAARHVLRSLAEKKPALKLNLPPQFPLHDESSKYESAALIRWFDDEATALGRVFDARSGTDYLTREFVGQVTY